MSYFLGNTIATAEQSQVGGTTSLPGTRYGRVLSIVLDNTVPVYDIHGQRLPIGAIKYRDIAETTGVETTEGTAIPATTGIKQYPLVTEVVELSQGPTSDIQTDKTQFTTYYGRTVNLWGSPHHNALPEPETDQSTMLGQDVVELSDVNPLFPFPGDTLIEGRQGQSIRIGGNKSPQNPLVDASNNGKPYILISNGQLKTDNGIDHIVEDINKDPNSIYLLSDHKTPLRLANVKRDSYDIAPLASNKFIGNQVIVTGGRLYLNAKGDSVIISAKESIGLSAKTVNIDANTYFCVDATKIYLGKQARKTKKKEPVVLGLQLESWLEALLDQLEYVATAMGSATALGVPVTSLVSTGPQIMAAAGLLRRRLPKFQSKKVFTE